MKRIKIAALSATIIIVSTSSILVPSIVLNSPDNIPPLIAILMPSENDHLSGIIPISFSATDQQGFIEERQIWINDTLVQTSSYNYLWDTMQGEDGVYTISCRAKDRTVWGIEEISVLVDNIGSDHITPYVIITSPMEGVTVYDVVSITMFASDANGISSYAIFLDGILKSNSDSYSWNTTQGLDGTHTILCEATDPNNNIGTDSLSVNVNNSDFTPPHVSINSPIANSTVSGTVMINMSATDANGISSYAIYIDNTLKSNTQLYTWNTVLDANGSYSIRCEASDPFDNNSSKIISVTVINYNTTNDPFEQFKLMTFNIKESGEDPTYPDWKEVVKEENADIIMFIETGYWDDNSNLKLNQYLNEFNTYFTDEDPYVGYCAQGISYGTDGAAIMSRYSIISYNQITHVPLDNTTSYDVTHDFFDVEVNVSGTVIHVIGSHLKAMPGSGNEQIREWEQEGIINYMDNLGNISIVYLGDLNSFSPEDWGLNTFQSGLGYGPLSMMVSPYNNPDSGGDYTAYSSTIHSWTDVHRTLNPTDWGVTYPGTYNSRIDFIYVNQLLASMIVNSTTGDTTHANTGSDHYTVDVFFYLI